MIVTPGTSWKWNSRSGRHAELRGERGARRRARPAPAGTAAAARRSATPAPPCRPWPSPRAGTRSTRRATDPGPGARGPRPPGPSRWRAVCPISTPTSAIVAITPARITDGSAPVITTKNDDRADAQAEPRPPGQPQQRGQPEDRRQHHRDVLARDHQQVAEPARLEVAHHRRVQPGGVAQRQPEQQPRLLRREEPRDRPADERPEHLRRTDERARRRPEAFGTASRSARRPCPCARARRGTRGRRGDGSRPRREIDVAAHPRAAGRRRRSTTAMRAATRRRRATRRA